MINLLKYNNTYKGFALKAYGSAFPKLTNDGMYKILSFIGVFNSTLFLLKNESRIIGSISVIKKINFSRFRKEIWIAGVYVSPEYRHQHFGTKMMYMILNECKKNKNKSINLYVDINNVNACKLYEKIGFSYEGTYKHYYKMIYKL